MITGPAKFKSYSRVGDNSYSVLVELTDPARSPSVFQRSFVVSGTTTQALVDSLSIQIAQINSSLAVKDLLDGIAVDTSIPITYTAPAPTTQQTNDATWLANVDKFIHANRLLVAWQGAGITPPAQFTTDYTALGNAISTGSGANGYTTSRGGQL